MREGGTDGQQAATCLRLFFAQPPASDLEKNVVCAV